MRHPSGVFVHQDPAIYYIGKGAMGLAIERIESVRHVVLIHGRSAESYLSIISEIKILFVKKFRSGVTFSSFPVGVGSWSQIPTEASMIAKCDPDCLISVGGGATHDYAKAVAAYLRDLRKAYWPAIERSLLHVSVATNFGSGAESSPVAVMSGTDPLGPREGKLCARPDLIVLDPTFTIEMPLAKIFPSVFDTLSHIFERYFAPTSFPNVGTLVLESLAREVIECTSLVVKDPNNLEAREAIMVRSNLAFGGTLSLGRGGDWAVHTIASHLETFTSSAHGEVLSAIFRRWIVLAHTRSPNLPTRLFKAIFGSSDFDENYLSFCDMLDGWGLPKNIVVRDKKSVELILERLKAVNPSRTLGNYIRISQEDIYKLLESILVVKDVDNGE